MRRRLLSLRADFWGLLWIALDVLIEGLSAIRDVADRRGITANRGWLDTLDYAEEDR